MFRAKSVLLKDSNFVVEAVVSESVCRRGTPPNCRGRNPANHGIAAGSTHCGHRTERRGASEGQVRTCR